MYDKHFIFASICDLLTCCELLQLSMVIIINTEGLSLHNGLDKRSSLYSYLGL